MTPRRSMPSVIPAPRAAAAFTLMEVMLALAVSAIVLAAIGGVFFSALRLRDRTVAALDEANPLQMAVSYLRRDLKGTAPSNGELTAIFQTPGGDIGTGLNYLIRFRTTTGLLRDGVPWGDVQEVGYALRPSTTRPGVQDLIRCVTRNLLSTTDAQTDQQFLLSNVQSLDFACYDGATWQDAWDTTMSNTNLPAAVRVRLQMAGASGSVARDQDPIELIIPLSSQSFTNQPASTGM